MANRAFKILHSFVDTQVINSLFICCLYDVLSDQAHLAGISRLYQTLCHQDLAEITLIERLGIAAYGILDRNTGLRILRTVSGLKISCQTADSGASFYGSGKDGTIYLSNRGH